MKTLLDQIARRIRSDRRAAAAVSIAILANMLFAGAYVWSRGGQTTTVEVVVADSNVVVSVDGVPQWGRLGMDGVPPTGGIVLTLEDTESVPSLPSPRGIDHVRVTDYEDGSLLFVDDFSGGLSPQWEV